MSSRAPGRPTTRDDTTGLPEWQALNARLGNITTPCQHGGTEWTSRSPRQQDRAAELCHGCQAEPHCRAYALAAGETTAVWGGLTPADLRTRL